MAADGSAPHDRPTEVSSDLPLPPGGKGLPLLGETLEFIRNTRQFLELRKERYGKVFFSKILGMRLVTLVGPDANRWIFSGENKYLKNKWNYAVRKMLGEQSLSMLNGEAHRARRRILAPHFKRTGLGPLVDPIAQITREHLTRWADAGGQTVVVERIKDLAFEIAARYIFGDISHLDLPRLSQVFDQWVKGLFVAVPLPLPGTTFGRAVQARRELFATLEREVARRARDPERGPDVLSTLLEVRDDDGQPLPPSTIVDEIALLMFAGHDTTVTSTSNILLHLAQHPEVLAKARAEQDALGGAPLTLEGLRSMSYLGQVIRESMRVIPPIGGAFRELTRDVEYGGFRLPKGWVVSVSPGASHFDEEIWTDPDVFDPERWSPERAEHQRHPLAFIPFGGGPRVCLGQHFALLEMEIVLAMMLREYTWTLVPDQDLEFMYIPFPRPKNGLRVTFRRREAR